MPQLIEVSTRAVEHVPHQLDKALKEGASHASRTPLCEDSYGSRLVIGRYVHEVRIGHPRPGLKFGPHQRAYKDGTDVAARQLRQAQQGSEQRAPKRTQALTSVEDDIGGVVWVLSRQWRMSARLWRHVTTAAWTLTGLASIISVSRAKNSCMLSHRA